MNLRYFDHNATTPMAPAAKLAWLGAVDDHWMNPSSPYRNAAAVKVRLESAREELADLLQVTPGRVVFCSGATEANNAVFRSWAENLPEEASIAVSPTEHSSVIEAAKTYFKGRIIWLPVDTDGVLEEGAIEKALSMPGVAAVSLMAANNESGVLQPWSTVANRCKEAGVAYHCDASQWVGKMPLFGLGQSGYVTACAHKFGGPKGVGFIVLPDRDNSCRLLLGGDQELGRRAGTEDVAGVLSMLAALKESKLQSCEARDRFIATACGSIDGIEVVGRDSSRLWNTVSLIMPEYQSVRWIRALEKLGFLVSSGSACSTGGSNASHVLLAMGMDAAKAGRVLRISAWHQTTPECWQALVDALAEAYRLLQVDSFGDSTRVISLG